MTRRLPLSALLSQALIAFTAEFEREVAAAGYPRMSLALGSNVMRFLSEDGLRLGVLAERAGVSKQAISQQIIYLQRHGFVSVGPDPVDNRAKVVQLTTLGAEARDTCRPLFDTIEQRWHRRFGADTVRQLRVELEALTSQLDGRLPHYPSAHGQAGRRMPPPL